MLSLPSWMGSTSCPPHPAPPTRSHYQQTLQVGILIVGTPVWGHTSKTFRFPGPLQAPLASALQSQ